MSGSEKPRGKQTLASEEVIEISHMGKTTPVATHLTELSDAGSQANSTGTRFTAVGDEPDHRRSSQFHEEDYQRTNWSNYLSIALLSCAIIACISGIYFATRKPSADSLYNVALAAASSNKSLESIVDAVDTFRINYPEDPRLAEFADFEQEIFMQRRINSLNRRARRGGDSALSPLELAFIEALQMREHDPSTAIQKLSDLLVVFQDRSALSPDERELIEYARTELKRLSKPEMDSSQNDRKILRQQLEAATQLEPAARAEFYRSIVRLYSGKAFAREIVEDANRRLRELESFKDSPNATPTDSGESR